MKRWLLWLMISAGLQAASQDPPPVFQQQLEDLTEAQEGETEDDSDLQALDHYRRHPVDLNAVQAADLESFPFLNATLINSFIRYRELFGSFTSIYELQAVPGWGFGAAARLAPYAHAGTDASFEARRALKGEQQFVLRLSGQLEKAAGYGTGEYPGSPLKIFFRYRYQFRNRLQWGLTAEKDAGESFFSGGQGRGFDFYSAHVFYRGGGILRSLVLGDFIVNMGQGLVHWQGLAMGRGGDPAGIKRQSPVLQPYTSAGEYNFLRGAGAHFGWRRWTATLFFSMRKLDAGLSGDEISSFLSSGYHRTVAELSTRANVQVITTGGNVGFSRGAWRWKLNFAGYRFSLPLKKKEDPYQLYAPGGREWLNASIDHSFTRNNLHLFGEWAVDKRKNIAVLQGALLSLHRDADLAILFRRLPPGYQTIYGNSLNINTLPSNETGLYLGFDFRMSQAVRLLTYADLHRFPWLKFRVDAPSLGQELGVQLIYSPARATQLLVRLRYREREMNGGAAVSRPLTVNRQTNLRVSLSQSLHRAWTVRSRIELTAVDNGEDQQGFLFYTDLLFKPLDKAYSLTFRFSAFETGGYDSRLYAFENQVLYNYSIPALYGRGTRYYLLGDLDLGRKLKLWARVARTHFSEGGPEAGGRDAVDSPYRTEWTVQVRRIF
jgi:hypothetical protein